MLAGDTLTLLGVPVGSGYRMGIDRDENGVLDGDEPKPSLRITRNGSQSVVAWPTNRAGYYLERATSMPAAPWNADTNIRGVTGPDFTVTNATAVSNLFFRLKSL